MNITQLKKLNDCKKVNNELFYISFTAKNWSIKNTDIREKKESSLKTYIEASKSFNKWKAYILSDDILKSHIEASADVFYTKTQNQINIFTNEIEVM